MAAQTDVAATQAVLAVGLASGSRTLDGWSRLLAALALLGLMLPNPDSPLWSTLLVLILLAGFGQSYCATRIAIDRPVFSFWAKRWLDTDTPEQDMAALDHALDELGLHMATPVIRSPAERLSGLHQLLRMQSGLLAFQAIGVAALGGLKLFA